MEDHLHHDIEILSAKWQEIQQEINYAKGSVLLAGRLLPIHSSEKQDAPSCN